MANVAVEVKIYPADGVDADALARKIEERAKEVKVEDIGFGIKVLRALFVIPDAEGGTDKLEEELKAVEGVSNVEVVSASRIG